MQKKRKNQITQPTGKILAKFEKWLQKADDIANAPSDVPENVKMIYEIQ